MPLKENTSGTCAELALSAGGGANDMRSGPCTLSIVVPTRNEEANVAALVSRLNAALQPCSFEWELIFVDDSDDGTAEAVRQIGQGSVALRLVHRPPGARRGGLGGAVNAGLKLARGEVVAVMDADLQHPPEVLAAIIAPILSGEADLVAGNR